MFSPLGARDPGEFAPLLFSLTPGDAGATPRSLTPHSILRGEPSSQRKSLTTPGSVQAEATPQVPPPPVLRLGDNVPDVVMEEPMSIGRSRGTPPPPMASIATPGTGGGQASAPPMYPLQQPLPLHHGREALPAQYEDVWVTIFGFSQMDVPLVLREFSSCGDILQWGTYCQSAANYLHVQFQNKYGAQRALLRNGEQLTPGLIIGVSPLDPRHRAVIESYDAAYGSPVQVLRPRPQVDRPYRVEGVPGPQQVPVPARSMLSKISQYVLGM